MVSLLWEHNFIYILIYFTQQITVKTEISSSNDKNGIW